MAASQMNPLARLSHRDDALKVAADYAMGHRTKSRPLHPSEDAAGLRTGLCIPLPEHPRNGASVISDLIEASEPGLVGNTQGDFFAWVMGGSNDVGIAADWVTSVWGQNAAIYQTSPAAAIAEEAVSSWILELLDLPRTSSVGLVTGATMAAFVGLSAARSAVLERVGHDYERFGLQNAPKIHVFLSEDAHITNLTAIRHIGLGDTNCVQVPSDSEGRMIPGKLAEALDAHEGPKIIISQAGHINSGAFEDFSAISKLAQAHGAWHHVDGAFGLWARVLPEKDDLTHGVELADSWSVDGHKWMQIPYDSGFAIVRDADAHRRSMDISASYLNESAEDGRNPTHFAPELSRRARGFAAWATFQALGRSGVQSMVRRHCKLARRLADDLAKIPGIRVLNDVKLNQVVVSAEVSSPDGPIQDLTDHLNQIGAAFLRTTHWKGNHVLRISVINPNSTEAQINRLRDEIKTFLRG